MFFTGLDEPEPVLRRIETRVSMPVPGGTVNSYRLGDPPLLIDPAERPAQLGLDPEQIAHVAVTHTHPDHVAGLRAVRNATDATVWALEHRVDEFNERTGVHPDRTFREGDEIGETGVTVLETAGHSPDHVTFIKDRIALVGDIARADGSVMVGEPDGDMRAYLTTLRRLRLRDLESAYPGHGPPIESPQGRFEALIAHRLERERRVESAINSGAREPRAIVDMTYDKDLTGVEEAAVRTVKTHIAKLAVEGRIRWDGNRAEPV